MVVVADRYRYLKVVVSSSLKVATFALEDNFLQNLVPTLVLLVSHGLRSSVKESKPSKDKNQS